MLTAAHEIFLKRQRNNLGVCLSCIELSRSVTLLNMARIYTIERTVSSLEGTSWTSKNAAKCQNLTFLEVMQARKCLHM